MEHRDIAISPHERAVLLALLRRFVPDTAVWAFGSRVKGTARPASDLDLVLFTEAEQHTQVSLLREAFDESNLPFRIDVLEWRKIPEDFKSNIEEQYAVLC